VAPGQKVASQAGRQAGRQTTNEWYGTATQLRKPPAGPAARPALCCLAGWGWGEGQAGGKQWTGRQTDSGAVLGRGEGVQQVPS